MPNRNIVEKLREMIRINALKKHKYQGLHRQKSESGENYETYGVHIIGRENEITGAGRGDDVKKVLFAENKEEEKKWIADGAVSRLNDELKGKTYNDIKDNYFDIYPNLLKILDYYRTRKKLWVDISMPNFSITASGNVYENTFADLMRLWRFMLGMTTTRSGMRTRSMGIGSGRGDDVKKVLFAESKEEEKKWIADTAVSNLNNYLKGKTLDDISQRLIEIRFFNSEINKEFAKILKYYRHKENLWSGVAMPDFSMTANGTVYKNTLADFIKLYRIVIDK